MDRVWTRVIGSVRDRRSDPVEPGTVGEGTAAAGRAVSAQTGVANDQKDSKGDDRKLTVFLNSSNLHDISLRNCKCLQLYTINIILSILCMRPPHMALRRINSLHHIPERGFLTKSIMRPLTVVPQEPINESLIEF